MLTLRKLRRWIEVQAPRDAEALAKLAHRGWFIGPRMPVATIPRLGRAIDDMPNEVDLVVGQHVYRYLHYIEAALIESYQHRSHLFREAFEAHLECKYSLSIQAFITQSDGIFCERFGKPLFSENGPVAVRDFSTEVVGRFFKAHLHPLTLTIPLWKDTRSLPDTFEGLNRHQVLHGMKANYNTELNSLKAISLLDYLAWVLNRPASGPVDSYPHALPSIPPGT